MQRRLLGVISVDSDATGQLLIIYFALSIGTGWTVWRSNPGGGKIFRTGPLHMELTLRAECWTNFCT